MSGTLILYLVPLGSFAVVRLFERTGHRWPQMIPSIIGLVASVLAVFLLLYVQFFGSTLEVLQLSRVLRWGMMCLLFTAACSGGSVIWLCFKLWPIADADRAE